MSVKDNDFSEAFKKSAGLVKPDTKPAAKTSTDKTTAAPEEGGDIDFKKAFVTSVKKKEPSTEDATTNGKTSAPGAADHTLVSDDPNNPLNDFSFKKVIDYANKPITDALNTPAENPKTFNESDAVKLTALLDKHKVATNPDNLFGDIHVQAGLPEVPADPNKEVSKRPFVQEYDNAVALEQSIRDKIKGSKIEDRDVDITEVPKNVQDLLSDLSEAENLRKKAYRELTIEGQNKIDAVVRTDQSGNLLKKTFNRMLAVDPNNIALGQAAMSLETQDKINKLPSQFATGLN